MKIILKPFLGSRLQNILIHTNSSTSTRYLYSLVDKRDIARSK